MQYMTVLRIIILSLLLFPSFALASDDNPKYRIQVILFCKDDFSAAISLRSQAENQIGEKAYLVFQNGCYKVMVGDFDSFREASSVLKLAREHYPDAWITLPYDEFVVYPVSNLEETFPDPSEAEKPDYSVKGELQEIRQVLHEILLVFHEINEKISVFEKIPLADTAKSLPKEPDQHIDATQTQPSAKTSDGKQKRTWFYASGGIGYADLHKARPDIHYANYFGYCGGIGFSYALLPYFALDLSADYCYLNAIATKEIHTVDGSATIFKLNPSVMVGTDINNRYRLYGKLGASYFNYDYAFNMTLKPGQSNGPSSIEVKLAKRASDFGLNAGIGIRMFRYVDLYFGSYFDYNSRRYHNLSLGITF